MPAVLLIILFAGLLLAILAGIDLLLANYNPEELHQMGVERGE